jgi:hypothetical protein
MTKQQFFEAFVAALRAKGETFVITENDLHHKSFAGALRVLKDAREQNDGGAQALPRALMGDEITGRFPELDYALSSLQFPRYLGAHNPTYRRVNIRLDQETAREILDLYPQQQRELISRMADVFAAADGLS